MTIMQTRRITITRNNNTLCIAGRNKAVSLPFNSPRQADVAQDSLVSFVSSNRNRGISSPQMVAKLMTIGVCD